MGRLVRRSCLLFAVFTAAVNAGIPPPTRSLVPPGWTPSWELWRSTIAMPCNDSGLMLDQRAFRNWGVLSWDWSNGKNIWINQNPMDAEHLLVRQLELTKKANPGGRHLVYRNSVHAMPWYSTVLSKLRDSQYAGFFLKFATTPPLRNGSHGGYWSPPCDATYHPPRCTELYHDQTQTPTPASHPSAKPDGLCAPSNCDCGMPCGMYLFNHLNGTMFRQWFLDEYLGGPTGLGHPDIDGFFMDDYWCWDDGTPGQCVFGGQHRLVGPAETEQHVLADLGLSNDEVKAMAMAWRANMDAAYDRLIENSAMSWDLSFQNSYNVPAAGAATVPRPTIILPEHCEAILTRECGSDGQRPKTSGAVDTSCCCATAHCPGACPAHCPLLRDQPLFFGLNYTSKGALSNPDINARFPRLTSDIELFLLVRGPSAFLGLGFLSCHPTTNYTLPDEVFSKDYGQPLENCSAMPGRKGVFSRRYSKARVQVDCNRLAAGDELS